MNAEALIGTVLGTCTLQQLVGQGGMGAVFLAQQSRPKRQVAVKVLLPMKPLSPNQLAAFLERFRRETDAAASMEHPNIMPVHEYGERQGLAYLVMPYVSAGTLRDELERCRSLPLEKIANYLEQIAAAIDFAHEHGVIHRDIKPANIMVTPDGRLLLADFGLVKIVDDGKSPQVHITGVGAPVGTPDYMSPEQVIGEEVDVRADLYSLGVVLYQMVTGTTPFRGETPMQIAAQHLQVPPPSAQMMRPDLPIAAEQVLQRALAKRPADRYESAWDLANAFRTALINSGIQLEASYYTNAFLGSSTTGRFAVPKGQFDPMRQTASMPKVSKSGPVALPNADRPSPAQRETKVVPVPVASLESPLDPLRQTASIPKVGKPVPALRNTQMRSPAHTEAETLPVPETPLSPLRQMVSVPKVHKPMPTLRNTRMRSSVHHKEVGVRPAPAVGSEPPRVAGGLLSRTGKFPAENTSVHVSVRPDASQEQGGNGLLSRTGKFPMVGMGGGPADASQMQGGGVLASTGKVAVGTRAVPGPRLAGVATVAAQTQDALWSGSLTSNPTIVRNLPGLRVQVAQELANPMGSSGPMRVVKIPVVGQPGQFVTGLLPVASASPIGRVQRGETRGRQGRGQASSLQWEPVRNLTLTLRVKIMLLVAVILLIAAGLAGFLWFTHHVHTPTPSGNPTVVKTEIL